MLFDFSSKKGEISIPSAAETKHWGLPLIRAMLLIQNGADSTI
jgi:hypothetical protein